jgi:hypothetical protein
LRNEKAKRARSKNSRRADREAISLMVIPARLDNIPPCLKSAISLALITASEDSAPRLRLPVVAKQSDSLALLGLHFQYSGIMRFSVSRNICFVDD